MDELDDDLPDLRDRVDDPEILGLFAEDPEEVQVAVRDLLDRARADETVVARLVETLDAAVDECVDATQASVWIAVVLGELRAREAIDVLLRSFASERDEALQDAAGLALLRIGAPALERVMDWLDDEPAPELRSLGYQLLGESGILDDGDVTERVRAFVRERVSRERGRLVAESSVEAAAAASARLGDRAALGVLRDVLRRDFHGRNPWLQDAIEQLEENRGGVAFVPTRSPWQERYGWLIEAGVEDARVRRPGSSPGGTAAPPRSRQRGDRGVSLRVESRGPDGSIEDECEVFLSGLDEDAERACYYWGLGSTARDTGLQTRDFLSDPAVRQDEDPDDMDDPEDEERS